MEWFRLTGRDKDTRRLKEQSIFFIQNHLMTVQRRIIQIHQFDGFRNCS